MLGLLFKDILSMKRELSVSCLMFLLFGVLSVAGGGESFFACMSAMLAVGAIVTVGTITADKMSGWDTFICASPLPRRTIIFSKYLLILVGDLCCCILVTVVNALSGYPLPALAMLPIAGLLLLFNSLLFPIALHFGQNSALIIFMLLVFVPLGILFLLNRMEILPPDFLERMVSLEFLSGLAPLTLGLIALILGLLLFFLSYVLSGKLYEKKEF